MDIPTEFQLNRTTNAHRLELLIMTRQHFQNAVFPPLQPCPDGPFPCPNRNSRNINSHPTKGVRTARQPVRTTVLETQFFILRKALSKQTLNLSGHPVDFMPKTCF
jgi:hypothetical protein